MTRYTVTAPNGIRHTTVICHSHRLADLFHRRYWVMCNQHDHEGPFRTHDDALVANAEHRWKVGA